MDRRDIALQLIDISRSVGLELGPLTSPLVRKDEAKILYADHLSTEDLRRKYIGHPFSPEDIVPVDYALKSRSLQTALKGKKFDYVLASHVIEHIPDMVTWLKDVSSILKEGGILSLVIPDKRYTFDIIRNESRPADVIGAYLDKQAKTSSVVMYDFVSGVREVSAAEVWHNPYADYSKKQGHSLKNAYKTSVQNLKPGSYVDAHCFVLTPYSFFEIVRSLIEHGLFDYEVAYFKDTPRNQLEFYVSLRKVGAKARTRKLASIPRLRKPSDQYDLKREVRLLRAKNQQLKSELHNLTTSKSWQLTRPLRRVVKSVRRMHPK